MRRKIVAIIGDAKIKKDGVKYKLAYEMGKALVDAGYRVQSGGMGGIMEAAFCGARSSKNYKDGDTIAIVPSFDATKVNEYADISIPTGLDILRNGIVANASAVIAIGGGAGTLSEMAFSWTLHRLVIAFKNVEGWSSKLADQRLDQRIRYENIFDDRVYGVETPKEAVDIINQRVDLYKSYHQGIPLFEND